MQKISNEFSVLQHTDMPDMEAIQALGGNYGNKNSSYNV